MKTRFIEQIGLRGKIRIYWETQTLTSLNPRNYKYANDCPNSYGSGQPGNHNATKLIGDRVGETNWDVFGKLDAYPKETWWPTHCDDCKAPVPEFDDFLVHKLENVGESCIQGSHQVFVKRLYNNPEGEPVPGDLYF